MGMTAGIYRASAAEIQRLRDDPDSVEEFMDASTWAPPTREVRPKGVLGWLLKLSPVSIHENDPDAVPPPGYDTKNDRPHCDLEGVWHGLHFLFTATAWEGEGPACYLLNGGDDIGDPDELGYSVLQALSPAKVRQFSEFLNSLSRQTLERRYDPDRMRALKIYPDSWSPGPGPARPALEHLLDCYENLRTFIAAIATTGDGAVVYLG